MVVNNLFCQPIKSLYYRLHVHQLHVIFTDDLDDDSSSVFDIVAARIVHRMDMRCLFVLVVMDRLTISLAGK